MSHGEGLIHRRPLTDKEYDWLKRLEAAADKFWNDLTDWERGFLENRLEAFRRFGRKTWFSAKQWQIIDKISEKIL
jgi:hypothetical protein